MTKARQRERKRTAPERRARQEAEWQNKLARQKECLALLFGVKEDYSDEEYEAADKAAAEGLC